MFRTFPFVPPRLASEEKYCELKEALDHDVTSKLWKFNKKKFWEEFVLGEIIALGVMIAFGLVGLLLLALGSVFICFGFLGFVFVAVGFFGGISGLLISPLTYGFFVYSHFEYYGNMKKLIMRSTGYGEFRKSFEPMHNAYKQLAKGQESDLELKVYIAS